MPERFCLSYVYRNLHYLCPFGRSPASSGERLTIKADLKGARQTELPLYFAEIILTPK